MPIYEEIDDNLFFELSGLVFDGQISFIDKKAAILVGQIGLGRITPVLKYCSPTLKNDRDLVLYLVSRNSLNLNEVKDDFKDDEDIVLSAIQKDGSAIQYASSRLKDNDKIIEYIIENAPRYLRYASDRFSKSKELNIEVLKKKFELFEHIHEDMKNDIYVLKEFWNHLDKNFYTNAPNDYHLWFFWEHLGDKAKPFFSNVENEGEGAKQIETAFEKYREYLELKDELETELSNENSSQNKKIKI